MFCTLQFLGTVTTLHVYVFIDVANLRGIRLGIECRFYLPEKRETLSFTEIRIET